MPSVDYRDAEAVAEALKERLAVEFPDGWSPLPWTMDQFAGIADAKFDGQRTREIADGLAIAFWLGILAHEQGWPLAAQE